MSNEKKRVYRSEARDAQSVQTRGRILATARELFRREGFEGVTIAQLAKAAEVSASMVYTLFQSKRGLLRAIMDEAFPPEEWQRLVEQVTLESSAEGRLRLAAKIARCLYDAEREQIDAFRDAVILAPEFKELEKEREKRRYARQEESMRWMEQTGVLAKGLTLSTARDIAWALTGRDLYRMLVIERGWSSDAYEEYLGRLLVEALICKEKE